MYRVVLVDDEPITRLELSRALAELDYEVAGEAADGFDAVELCKKVKPDIVLMDVKMPIFDGLTACRTITGQGLAGCVVMLTAYSDPETINGAKEAGASGYLVKPVDERLIRPTIEVAFEQSRRLAESRSETEAMAEKLENFKLIEQAKGILASKEGISETEAYALMRKTAMNKRISVRILAKSIIEAER